jgi:hypothetical protein
MKRNFLKTAFVCLFTVVALSSCEKDDDKNDPGGITDNTLTVVVENGNSYNTRIDEVKAEIFEDDEPILTLTSAEYKNGGFTLTLPEDVSSRYLESFDDNIPDGVKVSNKNVKMGFMSLEAYKSNDNVGYFYLGSEDCEGEFVYVDGDLSITGTVTSTDNWWGEEVTEIIKYSINLKRGWNTVYFYGTMNGDTYNSECTTTAPAGAKWYFYSYYDYDEFSASVPRAGTPLLSSSKRKIFQKR